jgi:putative FmdB family regulatory protein
MYMPLYEYKCLGCGHQFELLILKSSQEIACPACASASLERVLSLFAVSSAASRQASTAKAYAYNNTLNAKQEPDKQRVQIEHKHQH